MRRSHAGTCVIDAPVVPVGNLIRLASEAESRNVLSMREACSLLWSVLVLLFRSRASLEAEILILRHQLNIQRRHLPERLTFSVMDRLTFVGLYRLVPSSLNALTIVKPGTVVRWHRAGFRSYWRWKSRPRGGRPTVPLEIRRLIREMSIANPLWGAPRVHGELLKLGINIGQTSVAKYMVRRRHPPSQGWKTFIRNHADASRRWICLSCRQSRFVCSTVY